MNKIILSERNWRIYHALWLLMVMAVVVDMGAVLMESDLLMSAVATVSAVETSDWLSFSSEAVCLLSLSGLFWLLRNGREVPTRWRNGCLVAFVVTLAYAVTSKLPTLIFGPLSLDDGHWLVDFFNNCADILMLLVPATMIALFMVGASLCERVGKWSVAACCAIAINAPPCGHVSLSFHLGRRRAMAVAGRWSTYHGVLFDSRYCAQSDRNR